ncbi:MAG: cell division protein FtsQ/DivIB [Glaciecola sp.]
MTEQNNLPTVSENSEQNTSTQQAPIYIGLPVFVLVLILLGYAVYWANQWLQDEQRLPVQQVIFSGELTQLNTTTLERIVREQAQGSFFALDVNHVHQIMENEPWVFSASIRKRWPSKLYIHIIEQTAVARWNQDLLLNRYGETFDGGVVNTQLPELYGPGGSEKTVLTGYTHMQNLLNVSGLKIAQLVLSERFAWQAKLNNNMVLKLGRQEYINRLQRFIDVYPLIIEQDKIVEYVDLRYDTGLAVGWQQPNAAVNNNT